MYEGLCTWSHCILSYSGHMCALSPLTINIWYMFQNTWHIELLLLTVTSFFRCFRPYFTIFFIVFWCSIISYLLFTSFLSNKKPISTRILILCIFIFSVYAMTRHNRSGILVCSLPYGILVATYSFPCTSVKAIEIVEKACKLLRE